MPRALVGVIAGALLLVGPAGAAAAQVEYVNDGVDKPLIVGHVLGDQDATVGTFHVSLRFDDELWAVPPDAIHTTTSLRCESNGGLSGPLVVQDDTNAPSAATRLAPGETSVTAVTTTFAVFTSEYGNCDPFLSDSSATFNLVVEVVVVAYESNGQVVQGSPAGTDVARSFGDSSVPIFACVLDECPPPPPVGTCTLSFADTATTPFCSEISWLVDEAITIGCTDERFCPLDATTRGEVAVFLARWLDLPAAGAVDTFDDDNGHFAEPAIESTVKTGIAVGIAPGEFAPDQPVTRGQLAVFLTRALSLPDRPGADTFFDDDGHYAEAAIESLVAAGITTGIGGGEYGPDVPVTREQMAAFLFRSEIWRMVSA